MLHVFKDHIGRTVEAYVDDIVVKSRKADDMVADLRIAFDCLRAKGVKLNPEKCVFGVPRGMLLGFIFSDGGISMHLPAEWGPRTRETTLLGDSATTTRRAELGYARRGSPEDQDERL